MENGVEEGFYVISRGKTMQINLHFLPISMRKDSLIGCLMLISGHNARIIQEDGPRSSVSSPLIKNIRISTLPRKHSIICMFSSSSDAF